MARVRRWITSRIDRRAVFVHGAWREGRRLYILGVTARLVDVAEVETDEVRGRVMARWCSGGRVYLCGAMSAGVV